MQINAYHRWRRELHHAQRRAEKVQLELMTPGLNPTVAMRLRKLLGSLLGRRAPLIKGAETMTRQRRRAELRQQWYKVLRLGPEPRAEKRAIARAEAAGEWKRERGLPLAA